MEESQQFKLRPLDVMIPVAFVVVLWVVEFVEWETGTSFSQYGLYPRKLEGLLGIITAPFIHDDWQHLINNSIPLLVLGIGIFYFYRKVAFNIYLGSILITGLWVWVFARPSYHIGASGMVYTFASFIFWSGFFRKYYRLIALSLLVVFLYGSMVWGVFPLDYRISWESHLMGGLAGLLMSYFYRGYGPSPKKYDWQEENEEEEDDDDDSGIPWQLPQEPPQSGASVKVHYHYKPKESSPNSKE